MQEKVSNNITVSTDFSAVKLRYFNFCMCLKRKETEIVKDLIACCVGEIIKNCCKKK